MPCPPEDYGGPYGYANLVEALSNPKHPGYAEQREWVGSHWHPVAFDIDGVNKQLQPQVARWRPKGTARPRARARAVSH